MSGITDIKQSLKDTKRAFVSIGVFSMFINILMLTGPIFMLQIYDRVLMSKSVSTLISLSVVMVTMYVFMGALDLIRSRILSRIGTNIENTLNERTFNVRLQQGRYTSDDTRVSALDDLSKFTKFISSNAPGAFFDIPWTPIYLLFVFMLHWSLGVFGLVGMAIVLIVTITNAIVTKPPQQRAHSHKVNSQHMSEQVYRNAEEIVVLGMAKNLYKRWNLERMNSSQYEQTRSDLTGNMQSFSKSFRMFLQSGILGIGCWLAIHQHITPGAMIAASILLGRAIAPLQSAIGHWQKLESARDSYRRLSDAYEAYPQQEPTQTLPAPRGHLSVNGVMAGPPGADMATLQGLDFILWPGDALGVIGPSASGKSTLAKLLVGAWLPQRGSIRLDGATFDQWDPEILGKHIGYLPQKVEMFEGSVAENISRFAYNPQSDDVVAAAKMAGVHELILNLPEGYQAQLGLKGITLSGGQIQRIALARAVYGNPAIVVMDEPNSNLDMEGDAALSNAIQNLRSHGKTVIIMAHRASALTHVNKILKLDNGRQVAFGNKEKLAKKPKQTKATQQNKPQPTQAQARQAQPVQAQRALAQQQAVAPQAAQSQPSRPPLAPQQAVATQNVSSQAVAGQQPNPTTVARPSTHNYEQSIQSPSQAQSQPVQHPGSTLISRPKNPQPLPQGQPQPRPQPQSQPRGTSTPVNHPQNGSELNRQVQTAHAQHGGRVQTPHPQNVPAQPVQVPPVQAPSVQAPSVQAPPMQAQTAHLQNGPVHNAPAQNPSAPLMPQPQHVPQQPPPNPYGVVAGSVPADDIKHLLPQDRIRQGGH